MLPRPAEVKVYISRKDPDENDFSELYYNYNEDGEHNKKVKND